MKVLIYAPLAVLGHHFETDLEIIQRHIDDGDDVSVISCSGDLRPLNFYACRGILRCEHCRSRCREGIAQLSAKISQLDLGKIVPVECTSQLELTSFEAIKNFKYRDIDIGSAYLSSLISELRDPRPDLVAHAAETRNSLHLMAGLTDKFDLILNEENPDKVYFFNGRFSIYRPLLRLCQERKILFDVHERGPNNRMFSLTENNMPHDIETKNREIENAWADPKVSEAEKVKLASSWYENRARGIVPSWRSFTDQQDADRLPDDWKKENQNIAFFVSSEDEFASVPGWEPELFESQAEAIDFLCENFKANPEYQFFVRMHPNLKGLRNKNIEALFATAQKHSNCHLIAPESPVSTYAIIKQAKKVITIGSTVGIESIYWGTPSILLGKSFYIKLGASAIPQDKQDLLKIVADKNQKPGPRESALKFSYWLATVGIPFKHYEAMNLTTGKFRGHIITGNRLTMIASYIAVACRDILKVFKGEYSFWHLAGKIRNKMILFLPGRS